MSELHALSRGNQYMIFHVIHLLCSQILIFFKTLDVLVIGGIQLRTCDTEGER